MTSLAAIADVGSTISDAAFWGFVSLTLLAAVGLILGRILTAALVALTHWLQQQTRPRSICHRCLRRTADTGWVPCPDCWTDEERSQMVHWIKEQP